MLLLNSSFFLDNIFAVSKIADNKNNSHLFEKTWRFLAECYSLNQSESSSAGNWPNTKPWFVVLHVRSLFNYLSWFLRSVGSTSSSFTWCFLGKKKELYEKWYQKQSLFLSTQHNLGATFPLFHCEGRFTELFAVSPWAAQQLQPTHSAQKTIKRDWLLTSCVTMLFEAVGFELHVSSIPYAELNLNLWRTYEAASYLHDSFNVIHSCTSLCGRQGTQNQLRFSVYISTFSRHMDACERQRLKRYSSRGPAVRNKDSG